MDHHQTWSFHESLPNLACVLGINKDIIKKSRESVTQRNSVKKMFLQIPQNPQENNCARVSFLMKLQGEACNFINKKILTQAISCEICEIFKNILFCRTPYLFPKLKQKIKNVKKGQKFSFMILFQSYYHPFIHSPPYCVRVE